MLVELSWVELFIDFQIYLRVFSVLVAYIALSVDLIVLL